METRVSVKTYEVNICCEDCSKQPNPGCRLDFNGVFPIIKPYKYSHTCPLCERVYKLDRLYPYFEYYKESI